MLNANIDLNVRLSLSKPEYSTQTVFDRLRLTTCIKVIA
jgi:hypothetical protein